ncbi:MAG: adenylate/guanylate cyclase domain-containing protein [Spirochaetes bacterium]|nr:adenylate/guanylate cyclase domain-containing protein [Spirochaetota bacterium]
MQKIKIKEKTITLITNALNESFDLRIMSSIAQDFFPNYDINSRMNYPPNIPVPARDAAYKIASDIKKSDLIPQFVSQLIKIQYHGIMGRTYNVAYLRQIIKDLYDAGLIYDKEHEIFIEDSEVQITKNWGVLKNGEEKIFTFIRLDMVSNTKIVRDNKKELVEKTYSDIRKIVQTIVEDANGRIWDWEGDGGLCTFLFGNKNQAAVSCALKILHQLFIYNHFRCRLNDFVKIRIAVDTGLCEYSDRGEDIKKNDTIRKLVEIESKHTKPDSVTISRFIYSDLDQRIAKEFTQIDVNASNKLYNYRIELEK